MGRFDHVDDDELILETAAGSSEAFAAFYERHVALVLAVLYRRTRSRELAADLTGETFAAALTSCGRFRRGGPAATSWLVGIAENKVRESARRERVETRARERLGIPSLAFCDDDLERIEHLVHTGQGALALLEALPPGQRAAVRGRVLDERDYPDLAAEMGCSEQLVRQNVSRGLRRLRAQFQESQ